MRRLGDLVDRRDDRSVTRCGRRGRRAIPNSVRVCLQRKMFLWMVWCLLNRFLGHNIARDLRCGVVGAIQVHGRIPSKEMVDSEIAGNGDSWSASPTAVGLGRYN